MRVTVLIPTYNGLRYLVPCLVSLRAQTFRDFAVLVVDDGSTDGTEATLRRDFPEVAVLRLPENGGLARGQNAGVALCRSEFVAVLNNDTEAEPGWLAQLVAAADARPEAWAVAGKLRLWERRDTLHAAGDGFGCDGTGKNLGVWERDDGQHDDGRWLFGPQGGAALYRLSALRALSSPLAGGPFDESFYMYCEDVDVNWRAALAGYPTAFAPAAVVYHHVSATGGGALSSYYVGRNTLAVLAKNVPASILRRHWRAMAAAQLRVAAESVRHAREPAARARLRGQLAAVAMLPRMLRARRHILATRRVEIDALEAGLWPG